MGILASNGGDCAYVVPVTEICGHYGYMLGNNPDLMRMTYHRILLYNILLQSIV